VRDEIFQLLNRHVSVSHETLDRLFLYHDLLLKWQSKVNLIGPDTIPDSWNRHFLDSLQLLNYLPDPSVRIADLGSGAGFPGMVMAIAGMENVHLIESDTKKILFLKEVARITSTKVLLHHCRIEGHPIDHVDVVVSRACSSLEKLFALSSDYVSHETICLFHKGKNYSIELEEAKNKWDFDPIVYKSITDPLGVVLKIEHLRKRGV